MSKKNSTLATVFAIVAIAAGLIALSIGALEGRRAGYEKMLMYASPAVVSALLGIAIQRKGITYAGLVGGLRAVVGMILGN